MSLDKSRLKERFKQAYQNLHNANLNAEDGLELICQELADAVVDEIKELKIIYQNGLAAPNGTVTGEFNHSVS